MIDALRFAVQSIWINKAQYEDAERKFHTAVMQNQSKDVTAKPKSAEMSKRRNAKKQKQRSGLTPYQGGNRCFGEFNCKQCHRKWQSGFSWANMGQECKKCEKMIYPYKQHRLDTLEGENDGNGVIEHDRQKCEKCQKIKGDCRAIDRYW